MTVYINSYINDKKNITCSCLKFQQTKVKDYLSKDVDKHTKRS